MSPRLAELMADFKKISWISASPSAEMLIWLYNETCSRAGQLNYISYGPGVESSYLNE